MNRKYLYYIIFGFTFILFNIVQENIRPNYEGGNSLIIYFLGIIPNFLPGIGLPSLFYVIIPEVFKLIHYSIRKTKIINLYFYVWFNM